MLACISTWLDCIIMPALVVLPSWTRATGTWSLAAAGESAEPDLYDVRLFWLHVQIGGNLEYEHCNLWARSI